MEEEASRTRKSWLPRRSKIRMYLGAAECEHVPHETGSLCPLGVLVVLSILVFERGFFVGAGDLWIVTCDFIVSSTLISPR